MVIGPSDDDFNILPKCNVLDDIDTLSETFLNNVHGNDSSSFVIINQNIRSYNKNFDQFLVFLNEIKSRVHCIVLTETWLSNEQEPAQIDGFNVFKTVDNLNQNDGIVIYLHQSTLSTFQLMV
jgi:hypothetical protein